MTMPSNKISIPDKIIIQVDLWQPYTEKNKLTLDNNYCGDLPGEFVRVGTFLSDTRLGAAGFQYHQDYTGIPLDPENLNYLKRGRAFTFRDAKRLPGTLKDTLPGPIAQMLIQEDIYGYVGFSDPVKLAMLGKHTSGAYHFRTNATQGLLLNEKPISGMRALDRAIRAELDYVLSDYSAPAALAESSKYSAMSVRGKQPKMLYRGHNGVGYIAKFGSPSNAVNTVRVEASMMAMAKDAGIVSPSFYVDTTQGGNDVYFTARFDELKNGVRKHFISLSALTGKEQPGEGDFMDILQQIKKHSSNAHADTEELYRRMMMHNAVNNTDNHFRNFDLIQEGDAWRLAPAYDINPEPSKIPFATTMCGHTHQNMSVDFITNTAQHFGLPQQRAFDIARDVLEVVSNRQAYYEQIGVSIADQKIINQAIPMSDILSLLDKLPKNEGVNVSYGF